MFDRQICKALQVASSINIFTIALYTQNLVQACPFDLKMLNGQKLCYKAGNNPNLDRVNISADIKL